MEALTLEISNPVTLETIATAAASKGISAGDYALDVLETALLSHRPWEELVEPFAQSFDESGLSEDEIDALIEKERQAIWDEKHRK